MPSENQKTMENVKITIKTKKVPFFIKKMMEDKELVKSFHRGEISKEQLDAKKIRFITPI